ncbi:glycoside hydrolase N-terminal domain-containing protein [Paenibacillus sp. HWE-109]|uniref:glycosyl hydrolase family 95 catalytic domain-containing protein n=1 Tax=Paenibacillus sp. HWE-109 TaxID=1306526 RepID=UPI001EDF2A0B|nr:glycoside hydrolase N-terminal domain-containing protein [Paenibacillus sp. HWE-109]UKS26975.1 glycoside hydrolase N-terminal domain-containing protein [Paenibacillus sp. HWE-109]
MNRTRRKLNCLALFIFLLLVSFFGGSNASASETSTENIYECESVASKASGGTLANYPDLNSSAGAWRMLSTSTVGAYVEYTVNVPAPGPYTVFVKNKKVDSRGIYQLSVDGVNQGGTVDLYASTPLYTEVNHGTVNFASGGNKTFRFTVTGKNSSSLGYTLGLDAIRLVNQRQSQRLWYTAPAANWETEALPIGNGKLGGMVFGGTGADRVQINEATIFSGKKVQTTPANYTEFSQIKTALNNNDFASAKTHFNNWLSNVPTDYGPEDFGEYQSLGDINLTFAGHESGTSNYVRELNLNTGMAKVSYEKDGKTFTREYFSSYPDNVMVIRLTSSAPQSITTQVSMASAQYNIVQSSSGNNTLIVDGKNNTGALSFQTRIKVLPSGGSQSLTSNVASVTNADSVTILMSTSTTYTNNWLNYAGNTDYAADVTNAVYNAGNKTYEQLKSTHTSDYKSLFDRVSLDFKGASMDAVPTDTRLTNYKNGSADPGLESLLFQYGRYLLISSSRQGGQPANLQGIWNNSNNPKWGSMYCFNINFNMNYWPAQVANLTETHMPMIDLIDSLRPSGRETAKNYFNISTGWFAAKKTDVWGFTMPYRPADSGLFMGGSGWLAQDVWEYYSFTRDTNYLATKGYPILKEAAQFYLHFLTPSGNFLISTPSTSPENSFKYNGASYQMSAGTEVDHRIIEELFNNTITASTILGVDDTFRSQLQTAVAKIPQPQIGSLGQIKEWYQGDFIEADPTHRHISQLYGLFPGNTISPLTTPALANAAKVSLNRRGDLSTGWSMAWKINAWANLLDGQRAYTLLNMQLKNLIYKNLFDTHPPFQIDGNFGFTAGIAEMLLQSTYAKQIHLLPAMPSNWPNGSVKGLKARGNFTVDMDWTSGSLTKAVIKGSPNETGTIRYGTSVIPFTLDSSGVYTYIP